MEASWWRRFEGPAGTSTRKARLAIWNPGAPLFSKFVSEGPQCFTNFENGAPDGPRFRGYELPVYARRIAAAGARLCRQTGRALRHYPRAMGGAGQGGTHRGYEAVGTRGTDGNAADYADPADRPSARQRLDRTPRRRYRPPRQPALSAQGGAPAIGQIERAAFRADVDVA